MTTKGLILEQSQPSTTYVDPDGGGQNPPFTPSSEVQKTMWQKTSPWVHGALGVASFVPGLSIVTGGVDAAIYAGEGELVEAGIAAASMIPGGKVVTTAGKVARGAAGTAAKLVKGAHEAEEVMKAAKKAEETAKVAKEVKAAKEAREVKEAEEARQAGTVRPKTEKDTTIKKRKPGPCDHLRLGNGKGPYRGGAHCKTCKPVNDGKDSHHMPADDLSTLKTSEGPAIQMDKPDHKVTSSNGSSANAKLYRRMIAALLKDKQWRKIMAIEIKDVREIARNSEAPRKYNEAIREMLDYFKCLEKHGLLPQEPR